MALLLPPIQPIGQNNNGNTSDEEPDTKESETEMSDK